MSWTKYHESQVIGQTQNGIVLFLIINLIYYVVKIPVCFEMVSLSSPVDTLHNCDNCKYLLFTNSDKWCAGQPRSLDAAAHVSSIINDIGS